LCAPHVTFKPQFGGDGLGNEYLSEQVFEPGQSADDRKADQRTGVGYHEVLRGAAHRSGSSSD
jgi:hypothetical protein